MVLLIVLILTACKPVVPKDTPIPEDVLVVVKARVQDATVPAFSDS